MQLAIFVRFFTLSLKKGFVIFFLSQQIVFNAYKMCCPFFYDCNFSVVWIVSHFCYLVNSCCHCARFEINDKFTCHQSPVKGERRWIKDQKGWISFRMETHESSWSNCRLLLLFFWRSNNYYWPFCVYFAQCAIFFHLNLTEFGF